jgi:hypothetical protein
MSSIPDPKALADRVHMFRRYESAEARRARILAHYGPDVVRAHGLTPRGAFVQDVFDFGGGSEAGRNARGAASVESAFVVVAAATVVAVVGALVGDAVSSWALLPVLP